MSARRPSCRCRRLWPLLSPPPAEELQENEEDDTTMRSRPYSWSAVALVFGVPALGGFLFGFDISATSYAATELQASSHASVAVVGTVVSAASLGAFVGSLLLASNARADRIGRRAELRYAAACYIVGALLEVTAGALVSWMPSVSTAVLIVGRLIYGLGIAGAMHGGPTYIAEMSPSHIRGLLVSLKEAVIVLGILVGYAIGYAADRRISLRTTKVATTTTPCRHHPAGLDVRVRQQSDRVADHAGIDIHHSPELSVVAPVRAWKRKPSRRCGLSLVTTRRSRNWKP